MAKLKNITFHTKFVQHHTYNIIFFSNLMRDAVILVLETIFTYSQYIIRSVKGVYRGTIAIPVFCSPTKSQYKIRPRSEPNQPYPTIEATNLTNGFSILKQNIQAKYDPHSALWNRNLNFLTRWNRNHNFSKVGTGTGTGTVKNSYASTTLGFEKGEVCTSVQADCIMHGIRCYNTNY